MARRTGRPKPMSPKAGVKKGRVSRATFDNYVREGKLPKGKHEIGFKELSWSKKDLDEFVRKSRDNHSLRSKLKSQLA